MLTLKIENDVSHMTLQLMFITIQSLVTKGSVVWKISSRQTLTINNVSHMTLQFMLHHHTKFGYKRFSGVEDIIQTNINWTVKCLLWVWPWSWTQQSNIFTEHSGLSWQYQQTYFGCKRIISSKGTFETVMFWSHEPSLSHCNLNLEGSNLLKKLFISHDTLAQDDAPIYQV